MRICSSTHYHFQSLSIKLNQFNSKLFALVHTPADGMGMGQDPRDVASPAIGGITDEALDDEEHKVSSPVVNDYLDDAEDVLKLLKIGAVEKIFRLRNDVISSTAQILQHCQPVELGYNKPKYALNLLREANATSVRWGQLTQCKHLSFKAVHRVKAMLERLNDEVTPAQTPRARVDNINRIIEAEEEQHEEGLITLLERAYNEISDVRKIIGSALHTTERTTDDMPARSYEQFQAPAKSAPFWESKAARFRVLLEQHMYKQTQNALEAALVSTKEAQAGATGVKKELQLKETTIILR